MRKTADAYLSQIKKSKTSQHRFRSVLPLLSLMVVFSVFWGLKLTGITMAGEAFCGFDEHVHTEECSPRELTCTLPEAEAHTHGPDCLDRTLTCLLSQQEGHTHTDQCTSKTLTCTLEETPGHTHGEGCFTRTLVCTLPEGDHTHGPDCSITIVGCGLEESAEHTHTDACLESVLTCTQPDSHTHGDDCYQNALQCSVEEHPAHSHSDDCYTLNPGYSCGLEEAVAHIHSDACYTVNSDGFLCGLEESEGHSHTDECYSSAETCTLEVHIHTENCYSDVTADIETADDWEMTLANLMRSSVPAENVIMVAQSQLGYPESTLNFQADDAGTRRGITRYGQWYGNPYGDWSAMFVSFCLDYAGIMDAPLNSGPESMRAQWETSGLYEAASEAAPIPGDLVFLDKDENGAADSVAIITKQEENVLFTIEGDLDEAVTQIGDIKLSEEAAPAQPSGHISFMTAGDLEDALPTEELLPDRVLQTLYAIDDPVILGYGLLPSEPGLVLLPAGDPCYIWLDGTNGGLMALSGSPNQRQEATIGETYTLPTSWNSPSKYSYVLRGWYDVINSKYYAPGAEVIPTGNMVFYADWTAANYDIGQFNAFTANTVSTSDFVTIRMFDYGILFNAMSTSADVTVNQNSHTETWDLLTSGPTPYNGNETLDYIFRDWDQGGVDISYPGNVNSHNTYDANVTVHYGLYTSQLGDLLFATNNSYNPATGTGVIGKQYLGTADHLFQLMTDPSDPHYGYYYYDSALNAASYNQSAGRFYVYDYLERSTDSTSGEGGYSDFLPLNSPYVNTNGNSPATYRYDGDNGEYVGTTHYAYEAKNDGNSPVGANYLFGMSIDIDFYLPNNPGAGGNKDLYGNDMHFKFSGDDDVWVFVDGKLVLDLGGIHAIESGDVNFSTGIVTVNGEVNQSLTNTLQTITDGDHTLTFYYLERGSSQSNCSLYFNLAPRFSFTIQKEDFLTRELLNGAQFSVYTDEACTIPATLWPSEAAHDRGEESTNVFTVVDGIASMWGMGTGNTYYIKETAPPTEEGYGLSHGLIRVTLDKTGTASYHVDVIEDATGTISSGFTVHGFRIDEETQQAFIVATNAPESKESTTVEVVKKWEDNLDHSGQPITVYLTVTDPDGTVRRLQEAVLGTENGWHAIWDNLPKYDADNNVIQYGVEEAYIPGYYSTVKQHTGNVEITEPTWQDTNTFVNGKVYILKNSSGQALSTMNTNSDTGYKWVSEDTAANSPLALWTASVRSGTVRFTNQAGQTLTFYYGNGRPTNFYSSPNQSEDNNRKQYLTFNNTTNGITLRYNRYYLHSSMDSAGKFGYTTQAGQALALTPTTMAQSTITYELTSGYLVTNTPLDRETSLTVHKAWDYGHSTAEGLHDQLQVTVKLLANGRDTGRTVTLSLRNNWTDYFRGLPYADENGTPITYTVEESWTSEDWLPSYGEIVVTDGDTPTYSTTVTNQYRWGMGGPELPSTGTAARLLYLLCGGSIMVTSLAHGIGSRRKRERRTK